MTTANNTCPGCGDGLRESRAMTGDLRIVGTWFKCGSLETKVSGTRELFTRTDKCRIAGLEQQLAAETERCAKIAENVKGGYSANVRLSEDEQEFSKDEDGPWVLNSWVADAIRSSAVSPAANINSTAKKRSAQ